MEKRLAKLTNNQRKELMEDATKATEDHQTSSEQESEDIMNKKKEQSHRDNVRLIGDVN